MLTRSLVLALVTLTCVAVTGGAVPNGRTQTSQPVAAAPDVNRLGPQVGEKVPDFTLPDQDGRRRSLSSLMGEKGLVLVFNRSADW